MAFTVERYIAVCHPMRGRLLCTEQRARRAVLMVWAFCVAATSTVPWEYSVLLHRDAFARECVLLGSRSAPQHCHRREVHLGPSPALSPVEAPRGAFPGLV